MEAACGEYGDNVPRLVVAVKSSRCEQFQHFKKLTNCEKDMFLYSCSDVEGGGKGINMEKMMDDNSKDCDGDANGLKETAILEDASDEDEQNNGLMKSVTVGASASAISKDKEVLIT